MMKRGVKIGLIAGTVLIMVLVIGLVLYFNLTNKAAYHIVGVERTDHTAKDFVDGSELQFFDNGTFHVIIKHKTIGLVLTGIGTYELNNNTYELTFTKVLARNTNNTMEDITNTEVCNAITCKRSGNRITFTDHNAQIYYFG